MGDVVCFMTYRLFREAAQRAKELAALHNAQTRVVRNGNSWEVDVPQYIAGECAQSADDCVEEHDGRFDDDYATDEDQGEIALLGEDLEDDRDDWARSEEDGWFYDDD